AIDKSQMKVAYTAKTAGKVDFTVYNKADDKGFVILDNHDQVLGYSDRGSFDYDKMPDNMKWWLSQYQEQIQWGRDNHVKATSPIKVEGEDPIVVYPLLGDIEWSQGSPYNNMCPIISGQHCVVGCAATAMSQIMFYHKWPLRGHGFHKYEWEGKTYSCNFSESVYDWDNMLPNYRGSYSNEQADAVAKLCSDAGISLDMMYGISGSGAYVDAQYYAFPRNFAYSSNLRYLNQGGFSREEWEDLIRAELDAARPVFYSGQDNNNGGHAFVCDGYTIDGYFHFNWGWNGSGNAYFKIGALNVSGYKFNSGNEITIGLEPRKTFMVDGLCYELLADSTAALTYKDDTEYTEAVTIPEEITYEGKTYKVSRMVNGFLPSIDCVPSLQVPWMTPPGISGEVFSDSVYSKTVLIVPDNCVEAYAKSPFWRLFNCIKDTIGHSIEWGDLKKVAEGTGTYYYSANYLYTNGDMGREDPGLPISYRESKTEEGKGQFWIEHWSYNTDLYIDYDINTGNCSIQKQSAGFTMEDKNSETSTVYISDMPTFSPDFTYEEYPCKFDAETGLFTFNVIYTCGEDSAGLMTQSGFETFQVDGFNFSMSATYDYEKTFGKKIGVRIDTGDGVKSCKYVFVEGEISKDSAAVVAQQIADGVVEGNKAIIGLSTYKPASVSKDYTMVIAGFDRNGVFRNFISPVFNYNDIYNMMLGDANKDKAIDVADITTIASYILGDKPSSFNRF
ncbi:MAG: C10 family peptidase, partial [Prevotellaceae bacterium]|nr:C10 family peptidase [Prevotellaceae bacterium]